MYAWYIDKLKCAGSINKQWTVIYFSTSVTLNLNIDTDTKANTIKEKKNTIKYFTGSSDKFDPLQCTYLYCRWYNTEQRKTCTICRRTCKVSLGTQ